MNHDECARCTHRHRGHTCRARIGGVPGFPSTQHPCGCKEFVEHEEVAS